MMPSNGAAFQRRSKQLGIGEVITDPKSPSQNPYVERLTGLSGSARLNASQVVVLTTSALPPL